MNLKQILSFIITTSTDLNATPDAPFRTDSYIIGRVVEEVGEMADEISILQGNPFNIQPGKDGIAGETVDTFISIVDLYANQHKNDCPGSISKQLLEDLNSHCPEINVNNIDELFAHAHSAYAERLNKDNVFQRLVALQGQIDRQLQIELGLSYRLPEPGLYKKLMVEFILLNLFYYELISTKTAEETITDFSDTVVLKTNKWRKNRNMKELNMDLSARFSQ